MAAPPGSKAVGVVAELGFVVGFQEHADDFLEELVAPCRDAQRSHFSVRLRDFRPSNGSPFVTLGPQSSDDVVDLLEVHTIHRFRECS